MNTKLNKLYYYYYYYYYYSLLSTVQQHNEPSNYCIEALSVVVEGLHCGSRECLLNYAIFVAF